ncbi:lytic transglycosylase [Brevirhabdus pacifica]|uniref:Lytic transglycosylase n=1 Tax=Brevirhabdus pacifica TaxID=1267768 RepID=A0A1U7DMQ8_9RHOB|nr:lytic transglycosylase [Brevirhabdus pacifica]
MLGACAQTGVTLGARGDASITSERPAARPAPEAVMRWDFRPEGPVWTRTAINSLRAHGQPLVSSAPRDVAQYCPNYHNASEQERELFWAGLLSALAKHESTWRPEAVGGGNKWFGLLQISPATARGYGCRAKSGSALLDGAANLSCGVRIMARTVLRDNAIAANNRGIAADWTPFRKARMRAEMAAWTRQQPYCQG